MVEFSNGKKITSYSFNNWLILFSAFFLFVFCTALKRVVSRVARYTPSS